MIFVVRRLSCCWVFAVVIFPVQTLKAMVATAGRGHGTVHYGTAPSPRHGLAFGRSPCRSSGRTRGCPGLVIGGIGRPQKWLLSAKAIDAKHHTGRSPMTSKLGERDRAFVAKKMPICNTVIGEPHRCEMKNHIRTGFAITATRGRWIRTTRLFCVLPRAEPFKRSA